MILSEYRNGKIMQSHTEAVFSEWFDVVVAGLGTAGAIAAIQSAKLGLSVLGIERFASMGGMMTNGGVGGYYFGGAGGLFEQIDQRGAALEGYSGPEAISVDSRRYLLEETARQKGVHTLYQAVITGVYLEGKKLQGYGSFMKIPPFISVAAR